MRMPQYTHWVYSPHWTSSFYLFFPFCRLVCCYHACCCLTFAIFTLLLLSLALPIVCSYVLFSVSISRTIQRCAVGSTGLAVWHLCVCMCAWWHVKKQTRVDRRCVNPNGSCVWVYVCEQNSTLFLIFARSPSSAVYVATSILSSSVLCCRCRWKFKIKSK